MEGAVCGAFLYDAGTPAQYPTIPEKAAAYGYFIAEDQAFIDGDKRTALLAMTTFLDLNGYEIIEDEDVKYSKTSASTRSIKASSLVGL